MKLMMIICVDQAFEFHIRMIMVQNMSTDFGSNIWKEHLDAIWYALTITKVKHKIILELVALSLSKSID